MIGGLSDDHLRVGGQHELGLRRARGLRRGLCGGRTRAGQEPERPAGCAAGRRGTRPAISADAC